VHLFSLIFVDKQRSQDFIIQLREIVFAVSLLSLVVISETDSLLTALYLARFHRAHHIWVLNFFIVALVSRIILRLQFLLFLVADVDALSL
jgi:hypothetical protein